MDRSLLNSLWLVADIIRPRACEADRGVLDGAVKDNIRTLAGKGYLGLGVPREYGGMGADEVSQHEYTEVIASACGVTAFTQQQLRTGIRYVTDYAPDDLKRALLPDLAAGRRYCGIALSQMRRGGPPVLIAERTPHGFRLNGQMPWVTAWAILDGLVVAAPIPDSDEHILAYIEIERHRKPLSACQELPLVAMNASGTVSVDVQDLVVPAEHVLMVRPNDAFLRSDDREITMHTAMPLGCARASERYLREFARERCRERIDEIATSLMFEINHCRREALTWNCECVAHPDYKANALRARAGAIVLAMRAAHATIATTGGGSQLVTAAPQRLLREAQFYTTAVQTADVRASVLDQLFSPFFGM